MWTLASTIQTVHQYLVCKSATYAFNILPSSYLQSAVTEHSLKNRVSAALLALHSAKQETSKQKLRVMMQEAEIACIQLKELLEPAKTDDSLNDAYKLYSSLEKWYRSTGKTLISVGTDALKQLSARGREAYLMQALELVITNGFEAQSSCGVVVVKCQLLATRIQICIQDFGVGMSSEEQLFCTLVGYSGKHSSGIGLSCANRIVRELGGQLTVRSWQNIGSQFIFELPLGLSAHNQNL